MHCIHIFIKDIVNESKAYISANDSLEDEKSDIKLIETILINDKQSSDFLKDGFVDHQIVCNFITSELRQKIQDFVFHATIVLFLFNGDNITHTVIYDAHNIHYDSIFFGMDIIAESPA